VSRVAGHEKTGITVPAARLTSCVGIEAVIEYLGFVQDAFGFDFADNHQGFFVLFLAA